MRDKSKGSHSAKPKHVDMAKKEELKNLNAKMNWFFFHATIPHQPTDFENIRSESVFKSVNKAYTCLKLSSVGFLFILLPFLFVFKVGQFVDFSD